MTIQQERAADKNVGKTLSCSLDMKHIVTVIAAAAMLLAACGTSDGYFTIEGRFLNMNQGDIYVYSPDGVINGIDTIKVNGGRFAMKIPCTRQGTLMLVFPNFSRQPVFAQSGEGVDIKADASHLKEMEVTGTDDNELMTDFRLATASASPPEAEKLAEHYIRDNAGSPVATYLVGRYFATAGNAANLKKARELLSVIGKAQPKNGNVVRLRRHVDMMLTANTGDVLPSFTARTTSGTTVTTATLKGKYAVIATWASWSNESQNAMRHINDMADRQGGKVVALGICLDASPRECDKDAQVQRYTVANVCDGQLFDSPLLRTLGLHAVPDNILVNPDGKILARGVAADELEKYIR